MNKLQIFLESFSKLSLAAYCLIFIAIAIPIVEYQIDTLQSLKEKHLSKMTSFEIQTEIAFAYTRIPSIPDEIKNLYKIELEKSAPLANKSNLILKDIDYIIDIFKMFKMAILLGPVILFTLSEMYRAENEARLAKYMFYLGAVALFIAIVFRLYYI